MHRNIQKLVALLMAAQSLLAQYGEKHWSSWLENDARLIRNLDLYGVEHLLTAYGGMGSINDLVIHPTNGHKIKDSDVASANEKFEILRTKIYSLAKRLAMEEANVRRNA